MRKEETRQVSERLAIRLARTRALEPLSLRALLKATHLLGLALGARLAEMRAAGIPTLALQSRAEENGLHAAAFAEVSEILAARWGKVPDRHRPFYTSEQRWRILRLKQLLGMTQEETARRFVVSPETILRWEREGIEAVADIRGRLSVQPPIHWFADVVRQIVRTMDDFRWRNGLIAAFWPCRLTAIRFRRFLKRRGVASASGPSEPAPSPNRARR
jgi:DNA-binding XRE family transcriptional regulator